MQLIKIVETLMLIPGMKSSFLSRKKEMVITRNETLAHFLSACGVADELRLRRWKRRSAAKCTAGRCACDLLSLRSGGRRCYGGAL